MLYALSTIAVAYFTYIVQSSFVSLLPAYAAYGNVIIIMIVLGLVFTSLERTLLFVVIVGFLLDSTSRHLFGLDIIALLMSTIVAYIVLTYFFTNKSVYSFLFLGAMTTVLYELNRAAALWLITLIFEPAYVQHLFVTNALQVLAVETLINTMILALIFYATLYSSNTLSSAFIRRSLSYEKNLQ